MTDRNIQAIYRLSPLQEGMLFHTLESAGSDVYFQQFSCLLDGLENCARWKETWDLVAQRHAVMRTLFTWEKRDHPLQIVRERVSLPWQNLDWRDTGPDEQNTKWAGLQAEDRCRGFDLSVAPLMRFALVRLGDKRYRFLWSFHHMLLDGWSQRLIFNEVLNACRSHVEPLQIKEEVAPQYSDFIRWLDTFDDSAARTYWSARLRGVTRPTYIAEELPGRSTSVLHGLRNVRELEVDSVLLGRLSSMAREHQVTMNTVVVAAWALVLSAHSRSTDVIFGSTVSGRPVDLSGAERIAGLMINTLPLRVQVLQRETLGNWLRQLQSSQLEMRDFEQTPLVDIQKWSDLPPGSALFDSIIVFENVPGGNLESTTEASPVVTEAAYTEYSHYPLALLVDPGEQMKLIAVYQPDRIGAEKSDRLLQQLLNTLDSMVRAPESAVGDIRILPPGEVACLIDVWNQTAADFPRDRCTHELFEQCVSRNPNAAALVFSGKTLNFGEVNAAANQLARYLVEEGVGANSLVPVFMERGPKAIISFLAVMKAGAAYIPLDSGFPRERIAQILNDIPGANPILITQESLLDNLPGSGWQAICPGMLAEELSVKATGNLELPVSPRDLAYVIYTSGSTGLPKGAMVEHRGLVNSTWARLDYYPDQPGVFLLLSSLAVDSSVAGLYWCLCGGSTLLIATPMLELDVSSVGQLIAGAAVTHMLCIASLYQAILEYNAPELLRSLKTVIVAGEACAGNLVAAHQAALPGTPIYNEYGPSEYTVWATAANLTEWTPGHPVPIGRPVGNTRLYILDSSRQLSPIGVPGELYIGGAGLARGYLNRPEDTEFAFVRGVSFANSPEEVAPQLYKTGDLVRYFEDGNLEFLGRVDNQIKVRGYRIEPEEIEQSLALHPSVAEVVVYYELEQGSETETGLLLNEFTHLDESAVQALLTEAESLSSAAQLSRGKG